MTPPDEPPAGGRRLPRELSSFVGRRAELTALEARLTGSRLVSLTGPGGSGKTRLALRAAAAVGDGGEPAAEAVGAEAVLVELAPLTASALVGATVAQALGLDDRAGLSPVERVAEALGDRRVLLILDNCEHVVDDVAVLVVDLLERCGGLRILATSRQRLDVPGEVVFPVLPLGLPDPTETSPERIATAEAVTLFVDRATAVEPTFRLTGHNAAAVADICVHLDGIPLAIELAAARVRVLAPADIADHLGDRFGLLAGGPRAPARHRTLRALVQWSYDLSSEPERRLLARLSVFRDGFDLAAAETIAVVAAPTTGDAAGAEPPRQPEAVAVLAGLVERSLVQVHHDGPTRYSLLETIRSFAADRLAEQGEDDVVRGRHVDWLVGIARAAEAELGGPGWQVWSERLAREQGNVRAALDWALDGPARETGVELAARLGRWWFVTGRYAEGRRFLQRALEYAADAPAAPIAMRARLEVAAGWCAYHLGHADEAEALGRVGLESAGVADDAFLAAWARVLLAGLGWSAGDGPRVRELLAGAASWTAIPGATPLAARASVLLSNVTFIAGDLDEARRLGRQAVEIARTAPGRENLALALICSTGPALVQGDLGMAERLIEEAQAVATATGDRFAEMIARSFRARLFATTGDLAEAEAEIERCWAAGRSGGVRLVAALAPVAESVAALAAGRLDEGEAALQRAVEGGRAMGMTSFEIEWLAELACLAARRGELGRAIALGDEVDGALVARPERLAAAMRRYAGAVVAWRRGDLADAETAARDAAVTWRQAGARLDLADAVETLGSLACARGRWADGVRLLASADAGRTALGYRGAGPAACRAEANHAAEKARRELGEAEFERRWREGAALSLDEAVEQAHRGGGGRKRPELGWPSLTSTELQVVGLVTEGLRNDAIAERLYLSPGTVKNHLSHIFTKVGVASRAELAAAARRRDP